MINWDYMITYGGPELLLFLVIFIITPILYVKVFKKVEIKQRIAYISFIWIFTAAVGYADVFFISSEARRLCKEEAGLHVYKTVEAEGFLGASNIDYWAEHGFKFVEKEFIGGKKYRNTLVNSEITREEVKEILSRYEYKTDLEVLETSFNRQKEVIRDRHTGEILGEIIAFVVYPGWLDSQLLGILGFTWIPPRCDGDYTPKRGKSTLSYRDLVHAVIKPKKSKKENDS